MAKTILTNAFIQQAKEATKDFPVEGFLTGQGSFTPKFMVIGEAPGEVEALQTGIPFSGRAGKEFEKMLHYLEVTREEIYLTSPFRSRPYKVVEKYNKKTGTWQEKKYNRPPTAKELLAHAYLLDYELQQIQPKLILTMGNVGLQRLLGKTAKVGVLHGRLLVEPVQEKVEAEESRYQWSRETYRIFPTFHPAAVFYNPPVRELIEEDLREFKTLLNEKI